MSPDLPILLVVEDEAEAQQAQLELARIGFDQIAGFLAAEDLEETRQITQLGARDFLAAGWLAAARHSRCSLGPGNGIRTVWKER